MDFDREQTRRSQHHGLSDVLRVDVVSMQIGRVLSVANEERSIESES